MKREKYLCLYALLICISIYGCKEESIDYSTQVKPILNKRCITCHGGIKKQGGFSLLFEDEAKSKVKSGKFGIVAGDVHASEMLRRLNLEDVEERMPFEGEPLPKEEIEILTKWISQGAKWGVHWAYQSIKNPVVPQKIAWGKNDIDYFIAKKAEEHKLQVSNSAEPEILSRRLALDLIGFPAADRIKQKYLDDPSDLNYEALVDTLLASPHFGEKWASMWLDLARYADTKGYERDSDRNIWRYRDWLIRAFNADKPYNTFLTEQLAGDLLEAPTYDQRIATGFHRNTMTNDEGGTDNEEFRVAAVLDRVNTTWEALMGTTFSCVQCHSHPYDPFKHEDYYRFMAYFNNTRDNDAYGEYPVLRHFQDDQIENYNQFISWANGAVGIEKTKEICLFLETFQPSINSLESDEFVNSELADTKWLAMRNKSSARLKSVNLSKDKLLVFRYSSSLNKGELAIHIDDPNGPVIGKYALIKATKGWDISKMKLAMTPGVHDLYFTFSSPALSDPMMTGIQFDWFHFSDGIYEDFPKDKQRDFWNLVKYDTEQTPIMADNVPEWSRKSNVFERGSWLSKGEEVEAGVPESLSKFSPEYSKNRLGLAQWMTHPDHPLTSRTIVNRIWAQFFGRGIVETLEDLGTQGAEPSHPELLEYLSYNFIHKDNWSLKSLMKKIVMSATYRQDSRASIDQLKKDAFNIYLARGVRQRLSAEQIRDQALFVSGMLSPKMFGKPVMPYQPEGVWLSPYNGKKWVESTDDQKYRRALYTYWKRTAPYPSMINFDGVGREVCSARRINTNTPIQALTMLNDPAFVDLSEHFARKMFHQNIKESISTGYKAAVGRNIDSEREKILVLLYDKALKAYKNEKEPEIAALSLVANTIFNLDEVVTKN